MGQENSVVDEVEWAMGVAVEEEEEVVDLAEWAEVVEEDLLPGDQNTECLSQVLEVSTTGYWLFSPLCFLAELHSVNVNENLPILQNFGP